MKTKVKLRQYMNYSSVQTIINELHRAFGKDIDLKDTMVVSEQLEDCSSELCIYFTREETEKERVAREATERVERERKAKYEQQELKRLIAKHGVPHE